MLKTLRIDYVQVFINTSALLGLLWDKKSSQNALVFCGVVKLPARSWQRASVSLSRSPPVGSCRRSACWKSCCKAGCLQTASCSLCQGNLILGLTQAGTDLPDFVLVWKCRLVIFECASEVICCCLLLPIGLCKAVRSWCHFWNQNNLLL